MLATYDRAMTLGVFPHEGGYTNDAADPGGPTNWGITIFDARKFWNPAATAADVKAMPKSVAEDIYAKHYAAPLRYNDLPAGVDYAVLDYGINSGIGRAGKVLRRVCGMADNSSVVTDDLIAAIGKRDPKDLIAAICDERLRFLKGLKTWPVFGNGWGRRVAEVKALALRLADETAHPAPSVAPVAPVAPGKTMANSTAAPTAARNTTTAGTVVAGSILAAAKADSIGLAVAIVLSAIVIAVAVHFLWPKKD